ncbi:MAG: adenylyltransferase/cytidyltransferase family protein, partial [Pirellulales bacterium]|nr:adenylyltransferase/cytidyltransferase family protein [Pirellulales bacterium]
QLEGQSPKFPQEERRYFVGSIRYVQSLTLVDLPDRDVLPTDGIAQGSIWAVEESQSNPVKKALCRERSLKLWSITEQQLHGYPQPVEGQEEDSPTGNKKVLVTGCFDWFHSGHVRFFEEVSELGDLYVVVGHDANIKLLKGEGHPLYSQDERRYMVSSVRFVKRALVSSGEGWLDAEPEIERIQPDIYAVNEDGDCAEKRDYCQDHGIEYRILKRSPKEGLPKRESTALRGF